MNEYNNLDGYPQNLHPTKIHRGVQVIQQMNRYYKELVGKLQSHTRATSPLTDKMLFPCVLYNMVLHNQRTNTIVILQNLNSTYSN